MTRPVEPPPQQTAGMSAADIAALYAAYQIIQTAIAQAGNLFDITGNAVQRAWMQMHNARFTKRSQDEFVRTLLPILTAAQRAAGSITQSYLNQVVTEMAGSPPPPPSPGRYDTRSIRGVDPDTVYRRPITQYFVDTARGMDPDTANHNALLRALQTALADNQLARNNAAKNLLQNDKRVVGYRRVLSNIQPHCALCIVASTVRYRTKNLMPMHPNCRCTVAPIVGKKDPGVFLNAAQLSGRPVQIGTNRENVPIYSQDDVIDLGDVLEEVHDAIEDRFGKSYRDARGIDYRKVMINHDHGEMGPMMWVSGDKFTDEQHLAKDYEAPTGSYGENRNARRRGTR